MCYSACQQNCVCTRLAYFTLYDDTRRLFITGTGESGRATRHTVGPPRRDNVHAITRHHTPRLDWFRVSGELLFLLMISVKCILGFFGYGWLIQGSSYMFPGSTERRDALCVASVLVIHKNGGKETCLQPHLEAVSQFWLGMTPFLNILKRTQLVSGY